MKQNDESEKLDPAASQRRRMRGAPGAEHAGRRTRAPQPTWQELGDFIVSFGYVIEEQNQRRLETRVHYSQGDQWMHWSGIARQSLLAWMENQVRDFLPGGMPPPSEAEPDTLASPSLAFEFVDFEIADVRSEVPNALRASARLRIGHGELLTPGAQYAAELRVTRLDPIEPLPIEAQAEAITVGESLREIQCTFPVPQPGRYEVRLVVRRAPDATIVAESPGCRLNVEA